VPQRFWPLAADQLQAFGAFLDEEFRRHDTLVGCYETYHAVAQQLMASRDPSPELYEKTRILIETHRCGLRSPRALEEIAFVLALLRMESELLAGVGKPSAPKEFATLKGPPCLEKLGVCAPDRLWRAHRAISGMARPRASLPLPQQDFQSFAENLAYSGFKLSSSRAARLLNEPEIAFRSLVIAGTDRLKQLPSENYVSQAARLTGFALRGTVDDVDYGWTTFLPNSLSLDMRSTVALRHELPILPSRGDSLRLVLAPLSLCACDPDGHVSTNPRYSWSPILGAYLFFSYEGFSRSFGGDLRLMEGRLRAGAVEARGLFGVHLLQDSLRIRVGFRWAPFEPQQLTWYHLFGQLEIANLVPLWRSL
jgi:hypothetical protein